ncbi:ClpP/crotonase-like domain-containing protein [Phellopilus nigrolimitatus]|nr:ClpP/crotonase-like domain-containing protein [Phellopilus nigrolimitatus]
MPCTRLHMSVTFTALALLHRLKMRFPAVHGSSGHRLFLSAFMIGLFALHEINQMEREMCPSHILAGVALITLHRPRALNALYAALVAELNDALDAAEHDRAVGAVGESVCGSVAVDDVYKNDFLANWHRIATFRKPTIAAVSGYVLGGGCELALMCDILLAAPSAVFGQPEINLGVIPGAGDMQRLARAIGKARAMELVLTGATFGAADAARWGVAARVVEEEEGAEPGAVVRAAVELAREIAGKGRAAVQAGKESVNTAFELPLADGLRLEGGHQYQPVSTYHA